MHCMKLRGQRLMAHGFDRQIVEVQVCIAIPNGDGTLGIPAAKAFG